jgi:hypothetical protein
MNDAPKIEPKGRQRTEPQRHSANLVRLIINQDRTAQNWLKFFLGIEAALAAAFALVLRQAVPNTSDPQWFPLLAAVGSLMIPIFGMILTPTVMRVVMRQHQWSGWFIQSYNLIAGNAGIVFPDDIKERKSIKDQAYGYTAKIVRWLGIMITIAWAFALVAVTYSLWNVIFK